MDDPSRFTSINEYYTFIYAISYMMLVELGIWIYNFKGWLKRPDKKNNDYGTILIVMLGCWGSFYFSTYFRNQQFIQIAGEILLPHIFYCCCLEPKIFFHTFRQNGRQSTVSHNWRLPIY